jgi:hypothetical protein
MKRFAFVAALTACVVTLLSLASAQDMSKKILPTMRLELKSAVERTPEQMDAFAATAVMPGNREVPFRPTMDAAQYAQLKRAAELAPRAASRPGANAPASPLAAVSTKFAGASECDGGSGCWLPPDVAGAIGKTQFVSVSNDVFEVRSRAGLLLKTASLNGLFGYATQPMFDPRVQYDEEYQRWVITAAAFPESSTVQYLGIAVSKTSSATGSFWVYFVNVTGIGGTGSFYDYPMLGISQDAVLFTANVFLANNGFQGSSLFSLAKARIYNGFGQSFSVWTGNIATLEPAHQPLTDQNSYSWLAAAPGNSGAIYMYALQSASDPTFQFLFGPYPVTGVTAYTFPPSAAQPAACGGARLDTLDNRFQNAGTQAGDLYYQVHTVTDIFTAIPAPRYYIISGLLSFTPTVSVQADIWASSTSYDFNPSIAADPAGRLGVNWSVTDPPNGVNPSEHFADNNGGNPSGATGINVFTGASCYNTGAPQRWGDYSQVSVDPGPGAVSSTTTKVFWIDNETVPSLNSWSTEIAKIAY